MQQFQKYTQEEIIHLLGAAMQGATIGQSNIIIGSNAQINYYADGSSDKRQTVKDNDEKKYETKDETAESSKNSECSEVVEAMTIQDEKIQEAIATATKDKNFKYRYDWAMIKLALSKINVDFTSTDHFLGYLKKLGFSKLPSKSSIDKCLSKTTRQGDTFNFTDVMDYTESIRRNNIVRCFLSKYNSSLLV